jgi:hypothetical protein
MRLRSILSAALLAVAAFVAACQPVPGGGSEAPAPESQAPASEAPASDAAAPGASETPYSLPNY